MSEAPDTACLLVGLQAAPKQAVFFGPGCNPESGKITGSVLGPLVFDIVVDLVVGCWLAIMVDDGGAAAMTGLTVKELLLLFYADDGMIASRDPEWLQEALNVLVAVGRVEIFRSQ